MDAQETENELTTLLEFIRSERGFDFSGYKRPSLERRIGKRMQDVGIGSYGAYRDYLEHHDDEFVALFNTILINVTAFFRDELAWDYLRNEVVPQILENQGDSEPIRVWSTGCASGEEAYSLAIVLAEALGEEAFRLRVKIYATDVDEDALTTGRHAAYPLKTLEPVPEPLHHPPGAGDLVPGQVAAQLPGPELRLLFLHRRQSLLERRLARLEILQFQAPVLVGVEQALALTLQFGGASGA